MTDIDFVITWVDGSDIEWLKEKAKYSSEEEKQFNYNDVRFREWGLLKYWFRSVEIYAPWVRKIHFVTCGHYPHWLNINHPKLNLVKHEDYIPPYGLLPTFSSHPIELNLHRIGGLAEHFVYFNDDTYVNSPVTPSDFFRKGLPCDCAIRNVPTISRFGHIDMNALITVGKEFNFHTQFKRFPTKWFNWRYGINNFRTLLLMPWPVFCGFKNQHIANSYLKSTFKEVWEKYPLLLNETCNRRFRDDRDINQYVFKYWQLAKGEFSPRKFSFGVRYDISENNIDEIVHNILSRKSKIICLNDNEKIIEIDHLRDRLNEAFGTIFPNKSSFERD